MSKELKNYKTRMERRKAEIVEMIRIEMENAERQERLVTLNSFQILRILELMLAK